MTMSLSAGVPIVLPPLLLYANAIFAMAMVILIAVHIKNIVMILDCFFSIKFVPYRIDSTLFNKNQTSE
jgi:hypothetical protein